MNVESYDIGVFTLNVIESTAIIVSNMVIIATFLRHQRLLSATNMYILSMCFSSLLTGLLLPLGIGNYLGTYTAISMLVPWPCVVQKWKGALFYTTACNSIMCMLAIAGERWRCISSSTRLHRRSTSFAMGIICASWSASLAYAGVLGYVSNNTDIAIEYEDAGDPCSTNSTSCSYRYCYPAGYDNVRSTLTYHIVTLFVIFIIPLCAIAVIYALLVYRLLKSAREGTELRRTGVYRAKLRAIQAMVIIVIIFALCWLPGHIYCIWHNIFFLKLLKNEQSLPIVYRSRVRFKILSDFVVHLIVAHHWMHTLIYPKYSRQLASAVRETMSSFIFLPVRKEIRQPTNNATETLL